MIFVAFGIIVGVPFKVGIIEYFFRFGGARRKVFYNMQYWLKDISTPDFSTPSFNPGSFNPRFFNHQLFNHKFLG